LTNSSQTSNPLGDNVSESNSYHQIELPLGIENTTSTPITVKIHKILLEHSKQYDQQQQQLENLVQQQMDIFDAIYAQETPDHTIVISEIHKDVNALTQGMVSLCKQLEKNNLSQDISTLKSEQKKIKASLENQEKSKSNLGYLNWKQAAIIIIATSLISSLSSLAIVQLFWNTKPNQPSAIPEKPLKPKGKSTVNR
jgi:DNA repair exonuclease SbcCD ATPase subunit